MRIANTRLVYVILTPFPLQQWLVGRAPMLPHAHSTLPVLFILIPKFKIRRFLKVLMIYFPKYCEDLYLSKSMSLKLGLE
jgi:hypothetical protein